MKVYQLTVSSSEGMINTVGISTGKREILREFSNLVREYVADNIELNQADSSPLDPSLSYEDILEMPLSEVEALMDEIVESKKPDLTFINWSEEELEITKELSAQVIKCAEDKMVARWRQHALISEVDFLVGVMVTMSALYQPREEGDILWPDAPSGWIFGAMGNRSIVASVLKRQGHPGLAESAETREMEFTQRHRYLDELVTFLYTVMHNTRQGMEYHDMKEGIGLIRQHAVELLDNIGEDWRPNEEAT